jgi:hypothetical protein
MSWRLLQVSDKLEQGRPFLVVNKICSYILLTGPSMLWRRTHSPHAAHIALQLPELVQELLGVDLFLLASTSLVCQITLELVEPLAVLYQFAHGGAQ